MNTAACRTILHATDWHSENLPPPPAQRDWLLHRGSLTARLRQHGDIRVHIEHEGWSDDQPPVWQRDVWLADRNNCWIYAETRIPSATLARVRPLQTLGAEPIGPWLYQQNPQRLSLHWRYDPASGLYARHSTLLVHGEPLHIAELFLAAFPWP